MDDKAPTIEFIAEAIGNPNFCPICGEDWTVRDCLHRVLTTDQLSVRAQVALERMLKRLDKEREVRGS